MNAEISIVIICKNEEKNIEATLQSIQNLSNDIVVYDSGSTDATINIIKKYKVNFFSGEWNGFGETRQKANRLAKNNWVLVIDADEIVTEELKNELQTLSLNNEKIVYKIGLKNYLGNKHLKWGGWGNDYRIRLFHKEQAYWSNDIIHEKIILKESVTVKTLNQKIFHQTALDEKDFLAKMTQYAAIAARQYYNIGKKPAWHKRKLGSSFSFFRNYILKLGFLDGKEGYDIAKITALYTFLKYKHLHTLSKK